MSFGNFIELYELYYQTYESFNYTPYLKSIKFIRNAAAHNSCILSTMRKPNSEKQFRKTKQLANIMGKIPELREIEDSAKQLTKNRLNHSRKVNVPKQGVVISSPMCVNLSANKFSGGTHERRKNNHMGRADPCLPE